MDAAPLDDLPVPAPKRERFATKAEWAEARARELRSQAIALRYESSNGVAWKAARKYRAVEQLELEALRFDGMARTFRRKGI